MFTRFPYWGWLLLSILLWGYLGFRSYQHREVLRPAALTERLTNDLRHREDVLQDLLQDQDLFRRMFDGTLRTDEVRDLADQPFHIYAFDNDTLFFWNNNTVIATCGHDSLRQENNTLFYSNGTFLKKCIALPFLDPDKSVVILLPIRYEYPFENTYLRSHFPASDNIPQSTQVVTTPDSAAHAVQSEEGKTLFYLQFREQDIPVWVPDTPMIAGILLALIVSITWVNLVAVALARRRRSIYGLLWIAAVTIIVGVMAHLFRLPFNLNALSFFSSDIYASSVFHPSLGILILDLLCLLWLIIFILSYLPPVDFTKLRSNWLKKGVAGLLILLLAGSAFLPADMIRNLVINSRISFDVSHFYTINSHTVAGLFTIALIICFTSFFIYLLYRQLSQLLINRWLRYGLVALTGLAVLFLEGKSVPEYELCALGWLLLFLILLDVKMLQRRNGLFAPNMIFWASFMTVFATLAVHYFFDIKESRDRRFFAERIVNPRDNVMEFVFTDVAERIRQDNLLRGYLDSPESETRVVLDEHIGTNYLHGAISRFDSRIYLFDEEGRPVFNSDTTSIARLQGIISRSVPAGEHLFYNEHTRDGGYVAVIPVTDSLRPLGALYLYMTLKKAANETVYPELLQPRRTNTIQMSRNYSYAIYSERDLISQTNDYPFPAYLEADTLQPGASATAERDNYIADYYKVEQDRTVVIMHVHNALFELITLFSYLLGMFIVFALVALLFRLYFHYLLRTDKTERFVQLTLRKRIHFAMLGLVLISFLIIGTVTILFFVERYEASNRAKLQTVMQVLERSIQQYLRAGNALQDAYSFNKEIEKPAFRSFINNVSNSQSVDINVYNSYGALQTTSQEDIYNKAILARIMMPDAYYALSTRRTALLVQEERIGNLVYLSCYVPIRNNAGAALGYINVPFFASERELNYQISNILVALINLYAFIFLISSLLAVLITKWLTKTLHVIIQRFEQFSLTGENELLHWPYEDEIGVLINEYNKMVRKVAENRILLAQSERESAWREMAQQVAHEIKNPLTPMKLNIQYLQQALSNNHPNARQLTENVADSLIEQINNLSHIASAFSDFAKMPEARPEQLDLNDLLYKAAELYLGDGKVNVVFCPWEEPLVVQADKSQLLRVFTNLLQNAVESIPDDRQGSIAVILQKEDEHALVSITDNGSGIHEEVIGKIFSPYFTTKGSGTGLGLAMTKKIIEFWKGSIWFETVQGEGTTFFIRLPL